MKQRAVFVGIFLLVLSTSVGARDVIAEHVVVTLGEFVTLEPVELELFGAVLGSVRIKLGEYMWTPDELWLIPEGTEIAQYRSKNEQPQLPQDFNLTNNCKTSVYYNSTTDKHAFKLTTLDPTGDFCILAFPGAYDLYGKF